MVLTPWGESSSLREKRLRPGPGAARAEVEDSQRERLFGAMVATVAAKGYAGVGVADLVRLSGVSSRTFYDLFGDKRSCFAGAIEAVVERAVSAAEAAAGEAEAGGWEEQARAGTRAFAEAIAAQPAAGRLALIDAYAAGPDALAPLERATARLEMLVVQALDESPERAGMPPELVAAYVGAMRELAAARLREGRESELQALAEELWERVGAYRPPPGPLRLARRTPAGRREESLEAHDHAERAIRAFAIVVAEKGYEATRVDDVVARAGMSASTFYANFRGKEDALNAAIDSAGAQAVAAVAPATRRAPERSVAVRMGFGALFSFLASRPALARLVTVEVYSAGSAAVERRNEAMAPLWELLGDRELLPAAVYALAYRRVREAGPQALPALAPVCTYIALAPALGPERAREVANGK